MSVLSANFEKCRFYNFSGSYTKRSPSEYWSWTKTYSVIVTGASWVHFNPRKTKIGPKKSLKPFVHRGLQLFLCSQKCWVMSKPFLSINTSSNFCLTFARHPIHAGEMNVKQKFKAFKQAFTLILPLEHKGSYTQGGCCRD